MRLTKKIVDDLSYCVVGAAIDIHKELGPGLLENIYEKCLVHLLEEQGLSVQTQLKVPVIFRGTELNADLRLDLLVENAIVVELKSVENLLPIHEAQLLTYLKLLEKPKGILIKFNCLNIFKEGQKTLVTKHYRDLPAL